MKFLKLSAIILLVSLLAVPCFAEVPKLIEYIGTLEKANESPYPQGIYDINFQICTDDTCTNTLWSETHTVEISAKNKKDIDGGTSYEAAYKVILGSINPLDALAFDENYYLCISEVTLEYSSIELILGTPYSIRSDFANYAETVYNSETGEYESLQDIEINNAEHATEADNADTVDLIHASATPEANKLLALDGSAQFPDSVIPDDITINHAATSGDTDTVDGKHYSDIAAEIDGDIAAHTAIPDAHHTKTTSFTELTDTATDAQIPDDITINMAKDSEKLGGQGPAYYAIATHTHGFSEITGVISDDQVPNDITIEHATTASEANIAKGMRVLASAPASASTGEVYFDTSQLKAFIYDGTTWNEYKGPQGDKGDRGDKGDKGDAGIQGPAGPDNFSQLKVCSVHRDQWVVSLVPNTWDESDCQNWCKMYYTSYRWTIMNKFGGSPPFIEGPLKDCNGNTI